MFKIISIFAIFIASGISYFGQSAPTPSPTPSPSTKVMRPSQHLHFTVMDDESFKLTPSPTPTSTPVISPVVMPSPSVTPEPFNPTVEPTDDSSGKGWSFSGGIDFVSRYHGSNGQRFGGADQNVYGEAQYRFNPKLAAYCGGWYAIQFKELDVNCGVRFRTGRVDQDVQVQLLYLVDGKIPVYNFNYDASTSIVKTDKFSASLFGRYEYYGTRKKDDIRPGSYLIGGLRTDATLGKGWNLGVSPRIVYDIDGVFNADPGTIFLITGDVTKQFGKFTVGPGFKCSTNISTNDRPSMCTVSMGFSF